MSPFTIPDVANMVLLAGGEPVFFDSEPGSTRCDVNALSQLIDKDTACVLVTHYHVNEPRIAAIRELCRESGALLFDDCAIALGGRVDGAPVGTLCDASVFSLSAFKLLNFFWGGVITTSNADIRDWIAKTVSEWPRLPMKAYASQGTRCFRYDMATQPALYANVVFPMLRRKAKATSAAASLEWQRLENTTLDASLTSRPHLAAFAEWNRKLPKIDNWLAHRRRIAGIFTGILGENVVASPITQQDLIEGCFSSFLVRVPSGRVDNIRRAMMDAGFDVGPNVYHNVHTHPRFSGLAGQSANVAGLVQGSIFLPTHLEVAEGYATRLAETLANVLSSH
jgi:perosamine synthetase